MQGLRWRNTTMPENEANKKKALPKMKPTKIKRERKSNSRCRKK